MTVAGCRLGAVELHAQFERFRELGRHAKSVDHVDLHTVVRFGDDPPATLLEQALAVERGCCPFFSIEYDALDRRLTIAVERSEDRAALDALALALSRAM